MASKLYTFERGTTTVTDGVLKGVSVMKIGEAHGHDQLVDATTLEQVAIQLKAAPGVGVKVKMDHASGVAQIVGYIDKNSVAVTPEKVTGDLVLLETCTLRDYIIELATKLSDQFGLSAFFEGTPEEIAGELPRTRCESLYSVDIVTEPAANDAGLFSAVIDSTKVKQEPKQIIKKETDMTTEEFKAAFAECMKPLEERIAKMESCVTAAPVKETEAEFEAKFTKASLHAFSMVGLVPGAGPGVSTETKDKTATPTSFKAVMVSALDAAKKEGKDVSPATAAGRALRLSTFEAKRKEFPELHIKAIQDRDLNY